MLERRTVRGELGAAEVLLDADDGLASQPLRQDTGALVSTGQSELSARKISGQDRFQSLNATNPLNLLVVPSLYLRFAKSRRPQLQVT
jgi:hypothetical protein